MPGLSKLEWLECSNCSAAFDARQLIGLCDRCGGVLLARYRLDEASRTLSPATIRNRNPNLWRYAEVLPGSDDPVSLGEGMTPLLRAGFLAEDLGLPHLYIKDESRNPTGSFKARGMTTAVTMARQLGARRVALPSAGNAGGAAAAYAAAAGLGVDLFLPIETPEPFRLEAVVHGARVHLLEGDIAECGAYMRTLDEDWWDLSTLREPYRLEGKKTMGYELAEQFGWDLPEVVIYPTGGGTGLVGMWKAFEEMEQLELISPGRRPRMVVVQAEGCAPIVRAFDEDKPKARAWEDPVTYASGLRVPAAIGDRLILRAVRESGGTALAVSDAQMAEEQLVMSRTEGIFAAPEGGATLAAARRLVESGFIRPEDRVVLFNTGTGLKYPDIPGLKVP
ncbi:threonine synthase [Acidobacteria bacterium Mor1]|nr:threonine synthase [Acidobacteria bacterium Mor1]